MLLGYFFCDTVEQIMLHTCGQTYKQMSEHNGSQQPGDVT